MKFLFALALVVWPLWLSAAPRQLSGQHAPATSAPLSPAEAQKKFTVPSGFEVRLFAAEPEVINPVAMTWDERGRLWVVELYEYPLGAPKGATPRDRVIILEDTDGDGRSDKRTVFAEGLNLATGILLGNGGAYIGQAPHLMFLKDTNGDDVADTREVMLTGFGLEDRHELLNGFTWGPDGWLYMTHGVFTRSKVMIPEATEPGVEMNAAVARFHPGTKQFELFADGTSNPWGVDFDRDGNAFVSACVIDHLFHIAPGGIYIRQSGTPGNPYAYELLPSIVDHRHHAAAYAGVQVYLGNQYPAAYRGMVFMGNIHDNSVHQDRLQAKGSSFQASFEQDFLRANDGWFRPVSEQVGPDGALWIMDWYDKYPCYQNARADPEGVDRAHGRIWRVVHVGNQPGKKVPSRPEVKMNFARLSTSELVQQLAHANIWQRKMAQRLLSERRDPKAAPLLKKLLATGKTPEARLFAIWTLHSSEQLDEATLDAFVADPEKAVRAWVARFTGERRRPEPESVLRLEKLADDPEPSVRLAVAVASRQFTSAALTVDRPVSPELSSLRLGEMLEKLTIASIDGKDPLVSYMIWMAVEPLVVRDHHPSLKWMLANGPSNLPLSGQLLRKVVRRVADLQDARKLDDVFTLIHDLREKSPVLAAIAVNALLESQKGNPLKPAMETAPMLAELTASSDPELRASAQRLGALWGDASSLQGSLAALLQENLPVAERIKALQSVRASKNETVRAALLQLLAPGQSETLTLEAIAALGEFGGDKLADDLLGNWKNFSPVARRTAAEVLVSRGRGASALLSALESQRISPSDISATAIRRMTQSTEDFGMLARRAEAVFGKVRDADADKVKIITALRNKILRSNAPPDLKKGHELAQRTCFVCHKLHGEGAEVGPDLTGVGRSTLEALLANIIDPNQIIGAGYELVEIETKDGRLLTGRVIESNEARVRLLSAGPKEEVIARRDIAQQRVGQISLMPEGLEQMPEADFRNLIAYLLNPPQDNAPFSWKNEAAPATPRPAAKK